MHIFSGAGKFLDLRQLSGVIRNLFRVKPHYTTLQSQSKISVILQLKKELQNCKKTLHKWRGIKELANEVKFEAVFFARHCICNAQQNFTLQY